MNRPPRPLNAEAEGDDDFRVLTRTVVAPRATPPGVVLAGSTDYPVFISRAAVTNMLRHAEKGAQAGREVAGGLIGQAGIDPATGRGFTRIAAALAVQGHATASEVEITPEEWARLWTVTQRDPLYRDHLLLGWYHSHPHGAAYLSALDGQTQRQFFADPWQIALVVAPRRREVRAYHGAAGAACALYLDPGETGGSLIPVTYAVSAGAVSTPLGIEWLDPPPLPGPAPPAVPYQRATVLGLRVLLLLVGLLLVMGMLIAWRVLGP